MIQNARIVPMNLSTTKTQILPTGEVVSGPTATWNYVAVRDEPILAWTAFTGLLAVLVVVTLLTSKLHLGLLAAVAGGLILLRLLVRVTYHLTPQGVQETTLGRTRTIRWPAIAEIRMLDDGLMLLRSRHAGRPVLAMSLPWCESRDKVITCIEAYAPHTITWQLEAEQAA